uniref:Uncharacterized protein n=1 Tax=Timema shepardi TaxID=629360 RepID=A0A7R9B6K5_TIMSH|nr:unnamed protein product [Timema shepardi]
MLNRGTNKYRNKTPDHHATPSPNIYTYTSYAIEPYVGRSLWQWRQLTTGLLVAVLVISDAYCEVCELAALDEATKCLGDKHASDTASPQYPITTAPYYLFRLYAYKQLNPNCGSYIDVSNSSCCYPRLGSISSLVTSGKRRGSISAGQKLTRRALVRVPIDVGSLNINNRPSLASGHSGKYLNLVFSGLPLGEKS